MSEPDHGHDCDTPGCKGHWTCDEECGEPSPTTCRDCLLEQHAALLTLLSASVEPYLRRVQAVVERANVCLGAACNGAVTAEQWDDLALELGSLPTNPLEKVRAALVTAGRSLPWPGEGTP